MAFKDILIALTSYPDPTPDTSVDRATMLAADLGANIAAVTFQGEVKLTHRSSNYLANIMLGLPKMLEEEKSASAANARHLLDTFEAYAAKRGVKHESILEPCVAFQVPDVLIDHARLRDLTIIPMQGGETIEQWYAEAVIFGSGHPTILLPGPLQRARQRSLEIITVAWDFSRPAARALADAIPILKKAKQVRIVTVLNEKKIETGRSIEQLAKHLKHHDIEISFTEIDADGRGIGDVLAADVESSKSGLLVMGAYGHSRAREFILGGATEDMLDQPPVPVFLSH